MRNMLNLKRKIKFFIVLAVILTSIVLLVLVISHEFLIKHVKEEVSEKRVLKIIFLPLPKLKGKNEY